MLKTNARLACIIALPLLAAFCFNGRIAYAEDQPTQQNQLIYPTSYIPLKRNHVVGGQPIVQVLLNKTQSAAFLMDTSASTCILSPEMAKRLNLKLQPGTQADGTPYIWKGKQASEAAVSFIKIGNFAINIENSFFMVLPDQNSTFFPKPAFDDTHFDGVLGVNFLEHFAVLLDASQHTLGLCIPGNLNFYQASQLGYTAPSVVSITQKKDGRWYVPVQLTNNGVSQSEDLILDTGTNQSVISNTAAKHLGLKISEEQRMTDVYSNKVPVGAANVDTLQIGGIVLSGHAVKVAKVSKLEPPRLGMDVLSGYRVLMDFPAKKMYLQSNTATVPTITIKPQTPSVPVGNAGH